MVSETAAAFEDEVPLMIVLADGVVGNDARLSQNSQRGCFRTFGRDGLLPNTPAMTTLRRVGKSLASRYYQLLSGHAAIGSFLHERVTGPLSRESSKCRWCSCGRRESRHHLLVECKAWAPQIRRLWRRVGKDCGGKHPKAPAVRKLRKGGATEAVSEFLGGSQIGRAHV